MKTAIITIGDEILIGQIVDTNSAWMAKKMTDAGFEVEEKQAIGDDADQIKNTITDVFKRVDVVLMTGGLGPTKDDITKRTLCEYFGTELVFSDGVLENIQQVFSGSIKINELTNNQAYVPKDCTVIQNRVGTAPIMWFDFNGKVLVSMPGVPYEMQYAMEHEIIPRLQEKYETETYLKKVFIVGGYTESALAMHIADFENNLPQEFGLAYLPSPGLVKLRLFVRGEENRSEFERQVEALENILGDAIFSENDMSVEQILGNRLFEKGLTIGIAESCTGGNIARLLTSIPGTSRYFKGCVVSYSDEAKVNLLHVSQQTLDKYGAVSEETVLEMASGACDALHVDCSIAVSGIAGPDGGSEDKPVGTVWICTRYKGQSLAKKYRMGQFRDSNIMRSSTLAMQQLLEMINKF